MLNGVEDGTLLRFRCRVGHAYNAQTLLEAQDDTIEDALFTALRALEERGDVSGRLARAAATGGRDFSHGYFRQRAEEARRSADVLRTVLAEHRAAALEAGAGEQPGLGQTGT